VLDEMERHDVPLLSLPLKLLSSYPFAMRAVDVLERKRDGLELAPEEISFLIDSFTRGDVPDYQMSAFLMAVFLRGMTPSETVALTECMLRSGSILSFDDVPGPKVDKHSTGGVGDKTSLIIAPLAAACGVVVPMITGRGLAHSGGTVDKLESIPGFEVRLEPKRLKDVVARVGCALVGQTESIAPADRKLYALRDVTATVESYPLITGSILSKKLAEGISGLVLDVKVGSGAFMKTREKAEELARTLVSTAEKMGTRAVALLTDMSQPLGHLVGNALEVEESVATLKGEGPGDLTKLSVELTAHMLVIGGIAKSVDDARARVEEELRTGRGLQKFIEVVEAQGGDPRIVDGGVLPRARSTRDVSSDRGGFVARIDTEKLGTAGMLLGAGRRKVEDEIDPAAGLIVHVKNGDRVEKGQPLVTLHYNNASSLEEAELAVSRAYTLSDSPPPSLPDLVLALLEPERNS
jgi:pyrimidine-nucleoside phosphorylase/thymidine phosphorylase